MPISRFGPGQLSLTPTGGGAAVQFECQIKGGGVSHAYEETAAEQAYLGADCVEPAKQARTDSLSFDIDHSLDDSGLYAFCLNNDLQPVDFVYTPDTANGETTPASWSGTVLCTLPDGVQGSESGGLLSGSVEWAQSVSGTAGNFTFTAAV